MSIRTFNSVTRAMRLPWMIGGSLCTFMLISSWWYVLAAPTLTTQQEYTQHLNRLASLRSSEEGISSQLDSVTAELNTVAATWNELLDRTSPRGDEAKFLRWVTEQAEAAELVMRDFLPAARQPLGDYESRPVHLTTTGNYTGICRFLDSLRTGPILIHVSTLELTPREDELGLFSCSIQLNLLNRSEKLVQANSAGETK